MRSKRILSWLLLSALLVSGALAFFATGDDADARVRGLLLERRYSEAARAAEEALSAGEGSEAQLEDLRFFLGHARLLSGDDEGARAAFEIVLERHAAGRWASKSRFRLGEIDRARGEHDAARIRWRERAHHLVSPERKSEVAAIYLRFAKEEESADPPRWAPARAFYDLALELGLPEESARESAEAAARCASELGDASDAARRYALLIEKHGDGYDGEYRFGLAEAQRATGDLRTARRSYEVLLREHPRGRHAAAAWMGVAATHGSPQPTSDLALERLSEALQKLIREFPDTEVAPAGALDLAKARLHRGRFDDAVRAARDFLSRFATRDEDRAAAARALIGDALFAQRRFTEAVAAWRVFLGAHPFDARWAEIQGRVVSAELEQARENARNERWDQATVGYNAFLQSYPLDRRGPQVLFEIAQLDFQRERWQAAIDGWNALAAKHPGTEEASRALFSIGMVRDAELDDAEGAIEAFKRCNFGGWAGRAAERTQMMQAPYLSLRAPRVVRSDEKLDLELATRNIEELRVRVFPIDLTTYFLAEQSIRGVETLDIEVIEPAQTFDWKIADYRELRELERSLELSVDGPGAWVVKVDDGQLEATCLALRSDLRLLVRATRQDLVAYVENARTAEPVPGIPVRVSDGQKILFEGKSDARGLFYRRDDALQGVENPVVFASGGDGVAATGLNLQAVGPARKLAPVAHLATDRSAYEAGETVHLRAVYRDVRAGVFAFTEGTAMRVSLVSPNGATVEERTVALSDFGTLTSSFDLDGAASPGQWQLRVRIGEQEEAPTFSTGFLVARIERPALDLSIELDRSVLRYGEAVKGAVLVRHFHGAPAPGRALSLEALGLHLVEGTTDSEGRYEFEFETTDLPEGDHNLAVVAYLREEQAATAEPVRIVTRTSRVTVETLRDVYVAGETFDVEVGLEDLLGGKLGGALELVAYRLVEERGRVVEREELRFELNVDEEKGSVRQALALADGGRWRLRARYEERPDFFSAAQAEVFVSGEEDGQKIRILADTERLESTGEARLRVLSRIPQTRVLIAWVGDGILRHEVRSLANGESELRFPMGADLAPSFALALVAADEQDVHEASKIFTVPSSLQVELKPLDEVVQPGETVRAEILARDAAGQPVEAEFALSVIDEAFLAVHPDRTPVLVATFEGIREMGSAAGSSVSFRSEGSARPVSDELIAEAAKQVEHAQRLNDFSTQQTRVESLRSLGYLGDAGIDEDKFRLVDPQLRINPSDGVFFQDAANGNDDLRALTENIFEGRAGLQQLELGSALERFQGATAISEGEPGMDRRFAAFGGRLGGGGGQRDRAAFGEKQQLRLAAPRADFRATAFFDGAVRTDAEGKAVIEFRMPESATGWKWSARGITRDTTAGKAHARSVTRLALEARLDVPGTVVVGDEWKVEGRLLNTSSAPTGGGASMRSEGAVQITPALAEFGIEGGGEMVFGTDARALRAGEGRILLEATVRDGGDAIERRLEVEAHETELVASEGGVARDSRRFTLELPIEEGVEARSLILEIGTPGLEDLAELALSGGGQPFERFHCPPVDVTSAAIARGRVALAVLRAAGESGTLDAELVRRLRLQVRSALSRVLGAQRDDGGFDWVGLRKGGPSAGSDALVSTRAHAFLAGAKRAGFKAVDPALAKSRDHLVRLLARQGDARVQTAALAALAVESRAPFERLNRLLRAPAGLPGTSLAALAEACALQGRPGLAVEALEVALTRIRRSRDGAWLPGGAPSTAASAAYAPADSDTVEATARLLTVLAELRSDDAVIPEMATWLESRRAASRFGTDAAYEAGVEALLALPTPSGEAAEYAVKVFAGERELGEHVYPRDGAASRFAFLDAEWNATVTEIELRYEGVGPYAFRAVLRGAVPGSRPELVSRGLPRAEVERVVLAAPLRVDGRAIPVGFTTVEQIEDPWRHEVASVRRGEAVRVETRFEVVEGAEYLVLEDRLPAGARVVPGSPSGPFLHHEVTPGRLLFFFPARMRAAQVSYELMGVNEGNFLARAPRVWSYVAPERRWEGAASSFEVRAATAADLERRLTPDELYHLGKAAFDAERAEDALANLEAFLKDFAPLEQQYKDAARMVFLLSLARADHPRVVEVFEGLKDRYPELVIDFDQMLEVADSYAALGEHERSTDVLRGVTDASFLREVGVAGALEERGRFLESVAFLSRLVDEYPDSSVVVSTAARLPQMVASRASSEVRDAEGRRLDRRELLARAAALAEENLIRWPESPLADEVAFGLVSARLEREEYEVAAGRCALFYALFEDSNWRDDFLYARGYAEFALGRFDEALAELQRVETGTFPDGRGGEGPASQRDPAIWMVAQIHQARGRLAEALTSYRRVEERFSDAALAVQQLERRELEMEEVTQVAPGDAAAIELRSRNVERFDLRVYRVDLVRLYLLEKSLDAMTRVKLSGVTPQLVREVAVEGETEYALTTTSFELPLSEPGAYLIVAAAGELQSAGMLVVSDLDLDIWTEATSGLVRVAVSDGEGQPLPRAEVRAVGSSDGRVQNAETDLRGIASLGGIVGRPTLVVRSGDRVAFHRGDDAIGAGPQQQGGEGWGESGDFDRKATEELFRSNRILNDYGRQELEGLLKQRTKGVQVFQTKGGS